jgi:hypothetical protein
MIQETFEISLHAHTISLLMPLDELRHGRVATATPPQTLRAVMKGRFTDWCEQGPHPLLGHTTPYRGDSSGPTLPWAFRTVHPPERTRLGGPRLHVAPQRQEVLVHLGCEPLDRLCVEPCRSAMALDRLKGLVQRIAGDPARERVPPECAWQPHEPPRDPP